MIPNRVNFPVTLAPMVGLSHIGLRLLIKEYMPEGAKTFWPTEMLSSFKLPKEELFELFETQKLSVEDDLVPQILGNEESFIQKSVHKLQDWGALGIDINMGCPVKKALRHNYGVALMGDPDYAAEVVRMTVRNANVPVSVKLRAGKQNDPDFLIQFIKGLVDAGASWITLHPRTSDQKRRGKADWEQIRLVKEKLPIPVIGNGDIQVAQDIVNMFEQTRCDMVMVGRALTVRPWLMWQYGEILGLKNPKAKSGPAPKDPYEEGEELYRAMMRFIDIMQEHCEEKQGVRKTKFYINNAQPWLEFGHTLFTWTVKATTYDELRESLHKFFKTPQKVYAKTELRN
ncbi:MAG: tRNA-dihydrouridine synthase family protein [Bdellovibrionaceae bacterium]|nr:tRNA-dihydrouridine synthase family protein [Pseudobdellovibrionaceae bacterium]